MNNAERLIKLNAWKEMKDIKERTDAQIKAEREAKLKADIIALWDRAKDLIELYNAGLDMGLSYPKHHDSISGFHNKFSAMDWTRVGFGKYGEKGLLYNGIHANAITLHFYVSRGSKYVNMDLYNGAIYCTEPIGIEELERFYNSFPKLETDFYDWFDRKIGELG